MTLSAGQIADLILIDMKQPNMQPEHDIKKNLVYSGAKSNVKMTMVNGRILYRDGLFYLPEEADEIYRHANEIIAHMKDK